jgi:hypothetical protein
VQVGMNNGQDMTFEGQCDNIGLYGAQIGGPNTQNLKRITIKLKVKGGSYSGGAGILVEGNPAITATTTTASVTGTNGTLTKQFIQLTALNSGAQWGQWLNISGGGNNEDIYVYATGTGATVSSGSVGGATPPAGPWVYAIVNSAHTYASGASVGQATGTNSGVFNKGVTDVFLDGGEIVGSTAGNSQGVLLFNLAQTVDISNYNLRNAASGTGKAVDLINAVPRLVKGCAGLVPTPGSLGAAPTAAPASGTHYQNLSSFDLLVALTGGTVSNVTLYDATNANGVTVATATGCTFLLPAMCYYAATWTTTGPTAAYACLA